MQKKEQVRDEKNKKFISEMRTLFQILLPNLNPRLGLVPIRILKGSSLPRVKNLSKIYNFSPRTNLDNSRLFYLFFYPFGFVYM